MCYESHWGMTKDIGKFWRTLAAKCQIVNPLDPVKAALTGFCYMQDTTGIPAYFFSSSAISDEVSQRLPPIFCTSA